MERKNVRVGAGGSVTAQRLKALGAERGRASIGWPILALVLGMAIGLACSAARAASARLDFSVFTVSFPSADPDIVPVIRAVENPVVVRVRVNGPSSTASQLTVLAAGDLMSGSDQIPIQRIRWGANGEGFVNGQMSKDEPQLVGEWLGSVDTTGRLRFRLRNRWDYATGYYTQTVVYTLVAY